MTRQRALAAIYGAGTEGDQAAFLRLYTENRISYAAAIAEFRRGARFAAHIAQRDASQIDRIMAEQREQLFASGNGEGL